MRKEDLKPGMIAEFNDGDFGLLVADDNHSLCFRNLSNGDIKTSLMFYNDNFDYIGFGILVPGYSGGNSIKKIYKDYTLTEVLWERKVMPRLRNAEFTILQNLDSKYEYIARDGSGSLYVYTTKPNKGIGGWSINVFLGIDCSKMPYSDLFQFVKWEDEEPYVISELLEAYK